MAATTVAIDRPEPVTTTVTTSDGAELHVQTWGSGPTPLLCIPGAANVGDWYAPGARALADRCTTISYHQRGVGHSTLGDGRISVPRLAQDATEVLDASGHDRAVVLGQSMGGLLTQRILTAHADRVLAAVLVSTGPAHVDPDVMAAFDRGDEINAVGAVRDLEPDQRIAVVGPSLFRSDFVDTPAYHEWLSWQTELAASAEVLVAYLTAALSFDVGDALARVTVPTLVLGGDADLIAPASASELLASELPNSRVAILPGGSHGMLYDDAAWLAGQVRAFLDEVRP